jgi:hypothetical protein
MPTLTTATSSHPKYTNNRMPLHCATTINIKLADDNTITNHETQSDVLSHWQDSESKGAVSYNSQVLVFLVDCLR